MKIRNREITRLWNVGLWVAQILMAGMFAMAGVMKTFTPIEELSRTISLAGEMPILVRFIGASELAGAIGLVLPAVLRIQPRLTTLAAGALTFVMVLAMMYHFYKGEYAAIGMNIVLGILGGLIVFGRLKKAPIKERSLKTLVTAKN